MESITNLPPQLTPGETSALAAKPLAAFTKETAKLLDMTEETAPLDANLGKKVDIKA
jgi:hypothetical protein